MTAAPGPATSSLFSGGGALLLLAGNGLGAVCIVGNWWRSAGTADLSSNLSLPALAIVGVIVAGLTNTVWLLAAREAIERRRRRLSSRAALWAGRLESPAVRAPGSSAATSAPDTFPAELLAVEGATLYHRSGCPLVVRKRAATVEAHRARELRPCGVCEPGLPRPRDGRRQ